MRVIHNIFVDESGYTGPNLLDSAQPVLAMASLHCDDVQCADFKSKIFGGSRSLELKYSSLSKSTKGRKKVINFLLELAGMPEIVKVAVAHKKYALVGKMVDLIVETAMYRDGFDLYDRGANIALTNVMYGLLGDGSHDTLLGLFQEMIRTQEVSDFDEFAGELFRQQFDDEQAEEFLGFFRAAILRVGPEVMIDPSRTLDLAFTMNFTLASLWRQDIPVEDGIKFVHDESSIMEFNKAIWDAAVDSTVPKQEIGYDVRTHVFPIAVTETIGADSKTFVGIQLADVVAGATAAMGRALLKDESEISEYERELIEIVNSEAIFKYSVWPSGNVTPETLGTIGPNAGPLDDFVSIIHGADIS
jgi:hypothetical protein